MDSFRSDIITQLQKEILPLQGLSSPAIHSNAKIDLGIMNYSFPHHHFPTGVIHEFVAAKKEDAACTAGFVSAILNALMQTSGVCLWIGVSRTLFPPALKLFGLDPDRIIFIDLVNKKDALWTMEEAVKCNSLSAVVGEINELDLTASRRLQLAVEHSRVTGFLLRNNAQTFNITACVSRWKITPLPSSLEDGLPGVGCPRWKVNLQKIRNGRPGTWQLEWSSGCFSLVAPETFSKLAPLQQKKAG